MSRTYISNQDKIKLSLKRILSKKVFKDIHEILYDNKEYKFSNKAYLDELIDNRLKFVPIYPFDCIAISDKISLSTFISIKDKKIENNNQ